MTAVFGMCVLANGFHFSSLFLLIAAVLALPVPFLRNYLKDKAKIENGIAVVLSVAAFVLGMSFSPLSSPSDSNSSIPPYNSSSDGSSFVASSNSESVGEQSSSTEISRPTSSSVSSSQSSPNVQSKPATSNQPEKEEMVWISENGKKYHSKPSCSNMKNPIKISKLQAIAKNKTPCSKCC